MKNFICALITGLFTLSTFGQADKTAPKYDLTRPNPKTTAEINSMTRMQEGSEAWNTDTNTIWRYVLGGWIDTGTESGLTSEDINTFAELNAIVADATLAKSGDNVSIFTNDAAYMQELADDTTPVLSGLLDAQNFGIDNVSVLTVGTYLDLTNETRYVPDNTIGNTTGSNSFGFKTGNILYGQKVNTTIELGLDFDALTEDKNLIFTDSDITWGGTSLLGGGSSLPVDDTTSLVHDPADNTKQVRIDAGSVSTATVRTLTMPNADVNLGSLGSSNIADLSITGSDIANSTITNAKIDDLTIKPIKLETGVLPADTQVPTYDLVNDRILWVDGSTLGSGISNVVEDLTPQLGGNLDINGNRITGDITPSTTLTYDLGSATNEFTELYINNVNFNVTDTEPSSTEGYIYADLSEGRLRYHDGSAFRALAFQDELAGINTDDQTASEVNITDSGANYTGTTVEAALTEVADSIQVKISSDATGLGSQTKEIENLVIHDYSVSATPPTLGAKEYAIQINGPSDEKSFVIKWGAVGADIATGTGLEFVAVHDAITITRVEAYLDTAPTGSVATFDINEDGTSILSTKLTIDATENWSDTAATAAVISDTTIDAMSKLSIDVDGVGSIVAGADPQITIYYTIDP